SPPAAGGGNGPLGVRELPSGPGSPVPPVVRMVWPMGQPSPPNQPPLGYPASPSTPAASGRVPPARASAPLARASPPRHHPPPPGPCQRGGKAPPPRRPRIPSGQRRVERPPVFARHAGHRPRAGARPAARPREVGVGPGEDLFFRQWFAVGLPPSPHGTCPRA